MLIENPPRSPGRLVGLGLIAVLILMDVGLIALLLIAPIGILTVLLGLLVLASFPVLAIIANITIGLSNSHYRVENGLLIIEWGRIMRAIPLSSIESIVQVGDIKIGFGRFRGVRWPGCMVGQGTAIIEGSQELTVSFFATRSIDQQVLIVSESMSVCLSPADPIAFMASLNALKEVKVEEHGEVEETAEIDVFGWSLLRNRQALALVGAGLLLNLLLLAFLTIGYGRFPAEIPLHFDRLGEVDRIGAPSGLFILPLIGLLSWLSALLLGWFFYYARQEKQVAYILWGATIAVEIAAWIAVVGLLTWEI